MTLRPKDTKTKRRNNKGEDMKKLITVMLILLPLLIALSNDFPTIKGWEKAGEIKTYYPNNLWEYINGAADNFVSYGLKELNYCDIKKDSLIVTVNIYNMNNPLNAYGIYTSEKGAEQTTYDIGVESILSLPYQCLLLKDQYYVKIDVYEGQLTEEIAVQLLKAVSEALPGSNEPPEVLKTLPSENKIKDSENFIKENFLGLEVLKNCAFAEYKTDTTEYKVFKAIVNKEEEKEYVSNLKKKWDIQQFKDMEILYRKVPYSGYVGVSTIDNTITGIAGIEDLQLLFSALYDLRK